MAKTHVESSEQPSIWEKESVPVKSSHIDVH